MTNGSPAFAGEENGCLYLLTVVLGAILVSLGLVEIRSWLSTLYCLAFGGGTSCL